MAYIPHVEDVEKWKKHFSSDRSDKRMKKFYLVKNVQNQPIESNVTVVSPVESEVERAKSELKGERKTAKAAVKRHLAQLSHNLSGAKTKKKK